MSAPPDLKVKVPARWIIPRATASRSAWPASTARSRPGALGPLRGERAWGTVREDYSADGNAWDYFPHDHARSRAYRWGEDGLAGICDRHQPLLRAGAVERPRPDPEGAPVRPDRNEGNHGEDVKEYYFYLDCTPTHSYMSGSTSIRSRRIPTTTSSTRISGAARSEPEYELIDTGVFDDDRYFDVFVEVREGDLGRTAGFEDHSGQPRVRRRRRDPVLPKLGSGIRGPGGRAPSPSPRS